MTSPVFECDTKNTDLSKLGSYRISDTVQYEYFFSRWKEIDKKKKKFVRKHYHLCISSSTLWSYICENCNVCFTCYVKFNVYVIKDGNSPLFLSHRSRDIGIAFTAVTPVEMSSFCDQACFSITIQPRLNIFVPYIGHGG